VGHDGVPRTWASRLAWPAFRIAALLVVLSAIMLIFERKLIYYPQRAHDVTPRQLGLACEDLTLTAEDGVRIHAWYLPPPGEPRFTVLFAHGNAGNVSHRLDRALLLQSKLGAAVLLFDYRGYGRSEGSPDEEGTYRDARAAHRWLVEEKHVPVDRLVVFGESLGSAVALDLALSRPCRALVLESPFASVPAMARAVYPFLPLWPFVRTRYDNEAKVPRLTVPLLVLHGDRDEVVPFAQGRRVFEAAPGPKRFFAIPGAGHNDTYIVGGEAYWSVVRDFLETLPTR
jgi:pimeloyl-ACP methyl ester carboxylesterase